MNREINKITYDEEIKIYNKTIKMKNLDECLKKT